MSHLSCLPPYVHVRARACGAVVANVDGVSANVTLILPLCLRRPTFRRDQLPSR